MALNSDGVMLLAPGMLWGMLRERPVPLEALEVLEPDAWACGDDGLGDSIPSEKYMVSTVSVVHSSEELTR